MSKRTRTVNVKDALQRPVREKSKTAAHEMGHIIAHIVTETYFDSVWIAGVCEWHDRLHDLNKLAGPIVSAREDDVQW